MSCKWNGKDQPRIIVGRHGSDGEDYCRDDCAGCQPCTEPHCRLCGKAHTVGTCPECMAETRELLHRIARMCGALPDEVEARGVEGEAMFLLAPVADPEAIGHMEASVLSGRVSEDYLAEAAGDLHPAWVLGRWDMLWRDALEHDAAPDLFTIAAATDYLDRNITYMGGYAHLSFWEFNRDLKSCCNHMEAVLHDGEQVDQGAPCMRCDRLLRKCWKGRELPWSTTERKVRATDDGWACPGCKQWHNEDQYRLAVKNLHNDTAEWLTDRDMQIRTGVKAGTVRSWARDRVAEEPLVRKRREVERTVYAVADVLLVAKAKGLVA